MTKIKRIITSSLTALVMIGTAAVPSISNLTSSPVTVSAFSIYHEQKVNCTFKVKANSVFRYNPRFSSAVKCSVAKQSSITATKVQVNSDGTWYYSKYDKAWINSTRLF